MRILHLIHKPQNRGAETFACQLANHQKKIGHEVKIVAIYFGDASLSWEDSIENLAGQEQKFLDWSAWKKLAKIIEVFHPDIVQANSGDTLKYAVFSKKIFHWKKPIIFRNASEVGRYLKSALQKRLNSYLYKQISGVVSVSKASEKDLIYHFPFLKGKTKVIAVGLEEKEAQHLVLSPKNKQHIVHVGGFTFEKNHKGLLSIFKKILESKPKIHLHLIGDGILKPKVEQLAKKKKIQENVTFYGYVDNPLDYINAGDVLVLPSIIEGLPSVLLEAMYCKIPVVAYNVGGIAEIINFNTGSIVEKDDEEQFAKTVIKILEQQDTCKVENAQHMVKAYFMNKMLAEDFLKFYERRIIAMI